jgi:hypothetical protein
MSEIESANRRSEDFCRNAIKMADNQEIMCQSKMKDLYFIFNINLIREQRTNGCIDVLSSGITKNQYLVSDVDLNRSAGRATLLIALFRFPIFVR